MYKRYRSETHDLEICVMDTENVGFYSVGISDSLEEVSAYMVTIDMVFHLMIGIGCSPIAVADMHEEHIRLNDVSSSSGGCIDVLGISV